MPGSTLGDVLVHYKGRYYCFDANDHSLSEATREQEEVAHHAMRAGTILGKLKGDAGDHSEGCVCYVVNADALGAQPRLHGRDGSRQFIAFNAGTTCAFDPESLEPRTLPNATAKCVARSFDEGLLLGSMVQTDEAFGTNCALINAQLPVPQRSTTSSESRYIEDIVFHYRGRYYAVDTERSHCAAASGPLLEAAKHAVTAGINVGVDPGAFGVGTHCVVVDLSAISRRGPHADPVVVLRHGESQTQTFDLSSGRVRRIEEQLREHADESFSMGSWLALVPAEAQHRAGLTCYLVDLSALQPQRK